MATKKGKARNDAALDDPRDHEPKPPFEQEPQVYPGEEESMHPAPDYGEESYRGSGKLVGRVALITGGDSGIGRAVALAFAREGADVVISYLPEEETDAQEAQRVVEEAGREAILIPGDIREERQCQELVRRAIDDLGRLDVLVNNAAYQQPHDRIEDIPSDEFDRVFRTNVHAMFYLCKAAVPHMKPGSSIINTTSIQAYDPSANLLPYAATKGAIVTFTKSLSQMLAGRGIRVNAVAPGPIWTPLIPATMPEDHLADFGKSTPLGRPGQPAELAPVYVLLASNDGSYITGMVYGVTGGLVME